jgi:argininosuccinate lyase
MRKAARVIVIQHQNILVMKRNKFGQEYYCLIGGTIEMGETADQAAVRETYEESGLNITNLKLVYIEEAGEPYGTQYIFTAEHQEGDLRVQPDSIEAQLNAQGQNTFEPLWVPISKFAGLPFRSKELQQEILVALRDGFPESPKSITSRAEIGYTKPSKEEE